MNIQDLKPILDLMTIQHEDVHQKFNTLHDEISKTNKHMKELNGSIRENQNKIKDLQLESDLRGKTCGAVSKSIQESVPTLKRLANIIEHPKKPIIGLFVSIIIVQIIVMEAVAHGWLTRIIELIKMI